MNVVIFHYHLHPGGVTRIIESQVEALRTYTDTGTIKIITGASSNPDYFKKYEVELVVAPQLNYLPTENVDLQGQYQQMQTFLKDVCPKNSVLHCHNLNLGKNPLVTLAFSKMAQEGYKILNHAHDFSEDRAINQAFLKQIITDEFGEDLEDIMYPRLENYRFAVLNSFDLKRLLSQGVDAGRTVPLPNPVVFASSRPAGDKLKWRSEIDNQLGLDPKKKLITYPVRVIQRKNIAEYILLTVLFGQEANWVVTQPPKNPIELETYTKWKTFCRAHDIPLHWEAGTKVDFELLLRCSDFCFTTSIQEGFGMVFMEPWLLETEVKGRDIPMVTEDLKASGIHFPLLYKQLVLPNGKEMHELNLKGQFSAIKQALEDEAFKADVLAGNPFLADLLKPSDVSLLKKNIKVILGEYSLETYGKKLHGTYREIIG